MAFDPAKYPDAFRVRNLIERAMAMEVHCGKCGRFRLLDPAALPLAPDAFVPALGGRFKCTRCGSRQTEARPHYRWLFADDPAAV